MAPMIGMMTSPTSESTILVNAAPTTTAIARSRTLPFMAKSRNSFSITAFPRASGVMALSGVGGARRRHHAAHDPFGFTRPVKRRRKIGFRSGLLDRQSSAGIRREALRLRRWEAQAAGQSAEPVHYRARPATGRPSRAGWRRCPATIGPGRRDHL